MPESSTAASRHVPPTARSAAWKWVLGGVVLTTASTLLGKLPSTPMSAQEFGGIIGGCVSGAIYGGVLWGLMRLIRRRGNS